jgi:hypothetical protein
MDHAWLAAKAADDLAFQQYTTDHPNASQAQLVAWMTANPGVGPAPNDETADAYYNMVNGLLPAAPLPGPPVAPPLVAGEIRYTDLVPGQRYTATIRYPDPFPEDEFFIDAPYEGTYVSFGEYGHLMVTFRDVTNVNGELLDPGEETHLPTLEFIFRPVVQVVVPPKPWPQRNIPPNTNDVVNQMEITEGMDMVDFHGEYGFGRYYPLDVYDDLHFPKKNPITRQLILPGDLQYYTAHIAPAGGRRRKTKKSKRRGRKTRRSRK